MGILGRLFSHDGVDIRVKQRSDQSDRWEYETSTGIFGCNQSTEHEALEDAKRAIDESKEKPKGLFRCK